MLPPALRIHIARQRWLPVLALALLLGFAFQGTRGLWDPDEGRYSNVAINMLRSGDWITLRRHHESLHMTKPPVTYWAMAGSMKLLGQSEWALRLPNALAYVLTVLLVYGLGRTFAPQRPWLPALIYATSPVPFLSTNLITTDTLLACGETLALYCYVRARFAGGGARWLDAMWAGFGLAFMIKGPPALLPLLAIVAFQWRASDVARLWRPLGLALFALVGLTWYLWVIRLHPGLLDYFLGHEVAGRIAGGHATLNRFPQWWGPFFVYGPTLALGTLPWLIPVLRRWREVPRHWSALPDTTRFLLLWVALPLVTLCLTRSRLPLYILPLFVPISLLLAQAWGTRTATRGFFLGVAGWVAFLLALKLALALFPSSKDARSLAEELRPVLPEPPEELVFVEDSTRYGLALYLGCEIEKVALTPRKGRVMISDAEFDDVLSHELTEAERRRYYIMRPEFSAGFEQSVRAAGAEPLALARLRGRYVYRVQRDAQGELPAASTARARD